MKARFAAAVFDMDGLLLDSERPIRDAWLRAAAELGAPLTEADYLGVVGRNERESDARLLEVFDGDAALLGATRQRADALIGQRFGAAPFDVKPGALRLLRALHGAAIPCAVASSTGHREVERRLERASLLGFFSAVCGGDEVAHGKPEPDLYRLAVERLRVEARHCVAFEDSNYGARAALAAGLAVVVVPDLKPPEPQWQGRCLAVLASLEQASDRSLDWFGVSA